MIINRWAKLGLLLLLAICAVPKGLAAPLTAPMVSAKSASRIQVIESDQTGITLQLDTPAYEIDSLALPIGSFDQISIPASEWMAEPGKPRLPMVSALIGIPPNAQVTVRILFDQPVILQGSFSLAPAPEPAPLISENQTQLWQYGINPLAYSSTSQYPEEPIEIAELAWLRDRQIARLEFYPFQYQPAAGEITWHQSLRVRIDFEPASFPGNQSPAQSQSKASPFEAILASSLLNYETAKNWRGQFQSQYLPTSAQSEESLGARYRIAVDQDGLYQLSYEQLFAANPAISTADPATFHLFNQGEDVAILLYGTEDGTFDPGDYLLFYGQKFYGDRMAERYMLDGINWALYKRSLPDSASGIEYWKANLNALMLEKYTDENIYWLTVDGTPGPMMAAVDGDPSGNTDDPVAEYRTTERAEDSRIWWTSHLTNEETWFWACVWCDSNYTDSLTLPITLTGVGTSGTYSVTVRGEVVALNFKHKLNPDPPDHHTRVEFNSVLVDDTFWHNASRFHFEGEIDQSDLLDSENQLVFTELGDAEIVDPPDRIYFDWFEVEYSCLFQAQDEQIWFTAETTGTYKYQVSGFGVTESNGLYVLDISDPLLPVRVLNPIAGSGSVTISVTHGAGASYYINNNVLAQPASVSYYVPPDLLAPGNAADYVFITHADFLTGTQKLADYRALEGYRTKVVDIQDLYNEFNDGIYNPIAIKNFLAYAVENWETAPIYALIVGDGHWNFKGFNPEKFGTPPNYIPPYLAWVDPWHGEVDATNLLATVVGFDPLPDLMIARLPVNSSQELETIVNRIIDYESEPEQQDWQSNITFVADNVPDSAGQFVLLSNDIITDYIDPLPYYHPLRIYENDFGCVSTITTPSQCEQVTGEITNTLNNTGTLIVNYIGHGGYKFWSHEQILDISDIPSLDNNEQLPVILSMTCLDGAWYHPDHPLIAPGLIESLLRAENGGIIGAFSPTGQGVSTGHDYLNRGFFESLFDNGVWDLGSASINAKLRLYATGSNFDLLHTFTVFGDPALHIQNPYQFEIDPHTQAKQTNPDETIAFTITLTNTGTFSDSFTITINGNNWPTTSTITSTNSIAPDQNAKIHIDVEVPASPASTSDIAQITIRSQGDTSKSEIAYITSYIGSQIPYQLELNPKTISKNAFLGETVTYTLTISNTGIAPDIYFSEIAGNVWMTTFPSTASLWPGNSVDLPIEVQVPEAVTNPIDIAQITINSDGDPTKSQTASLTTSVNYQFDLSPSAQALSTDPGETILYTLTITNTGASSDTYDIHIFNNLWPTSPDMIPIIPSGQSQNFSVAVDVPPKTLNPTDAADIFVISLGDPRLVKTSSITTTIDYQFDINPIQDQRFANPGDRVVYTLTLTNTGALTDSYEINLTGDVWPTILQHGSNNNILPGQSLVINILIDIPSMATRFQDTVQITISSKKDFNKSQVCVLTTSIRNVLFLPIIRK
jgi:uncharacterized membrane protein